MIGGFILQAAIIAAAYLVGRYQVPFKLALYIRARLCKHNNQVPFGTTGNNVCMDCRVIVKPGDKKFVQLLNPTE